MNNIYSVLIGAVVILAAALVTWGVVALVGWINTKIENERVRATLANVRDIITAAVADTSQNFVDDLKKNGKFEHDKQIEAFNLTLDNVMAQLTAEVVSLISKVTADVETWIGAEIEKAVRDSKKEA